MMRSGRIRSALTTSWRIVISPRPSILEGRELQGNHMFLTQLQFCSILDGHNPLIAGDKTGKDVQQSCFTRTSTSGNDNVNPGFHAGFEEIESPQG